MIRNSEPPSLSNGALELLRIAAENDKYGAMMRNACLLTAISSTGQLLASSSGGPREIARVLRVPSPPECFVSFVALLLRNIQQTLDDRFGNTSEKSAFPLVTDFNSHVFEAEALTLADLVWPDRHAEDFDGPKIDIVAKRLVAANQIDVWRSFVQHYVGNILQDVFAAARIRETVRNLPPETEQQLRSDDAKKFSAFVFDAYDVNTPEVLMNSLGKALRLAIS